MPRRFLRISFVHEDTGRGCQHFDDTTFAGVESKNRSDESMTRERIQNINR